MFHNISQCYAKFKQAKVVHIQKLANQSIYN